MQRSIHPTQDQVNILYNTSKGILDKIAHKISARIQYPFDDIRAEADLLFMRALDKYNPAQEVRFTSFLYAVVYNGLITYGQTICKQSFTQITTIKQDGEDLDILDVCIDERADASYAFSAFLHDLSFSEKELVELVTMGFATDERSLRKLAINRLGYDDELIDDCLEHIKSQLM